MSTAVLGRYLWRSMIITGVMLSGTAVIYAQSIADAGRVVDAIAEASAVNPLLAVIKILAWIVVGNLVLSAWLVRIVVKQADIEARMASKPCVLAHVNPGLFAKILEIR